MDYLEKKVVKEGKAKVAEPVEKRGGKVSLGDKLARFVSKYDIKKPKDDSAIRFTVTATLAVVEEVNGLITGLTEDLVTIQTRIKSTNGTRVFSIDDVVSIAGGLDKPSSVTVKSNVVISSASGSIVKPKDGLADFVYVRTDDKTLVAFNRKQSKVAIVSEKVSK